MVTFPFRVCWDFAVCLQDVGGDDNAHIMTEELGQGLGQSAGGMSQQCLASFSAGIKQINLLSDLTLQEARTWDEGLASRFSTTPLSDIFKVTNNTFMPGCL